MDEKYEQNDAFRDVPPAPEAPEPPRTDDAGEPPRGANIPPQPQAAPPKKVRRAGTFTLGLVLVAAGVLLILRTVAPDLNLTFAANLAPVVLIALGIEVLVYAARPDVKLKYDGVSIFLCLLILLFVGGAGLFGKVWDTYGPSANLAESRLSDEYETQAAALLRADGALTDTINDLSVHVDLVQPVTDPSTAALQAGDYMTLYITVWPGAYSDRLAFATMARTVIDRCQAAGLPFTNYQFDTLQRDIPDDSVTYELFVNSAWQFDATAENLAREVYETYWYNDSGFSSYEEMENYREEMLRSNLSEEYWQEFGDYPPEDWLDDQMAKVATAETAAPAAAEAPESSTSAPLAPEAPESPEVTVENADRV